MNKVKIGIIGAGGRANFQARAIVESGIGGSVIVYSPFEEEVKNFAEKYKIKYYCGKCLDRNGKYVCDGKIIRVIPPEKNNMTAIVSFSFPKKYYNIVRSFKR